MIAMKFGSWKKLKLSNYFLINKKLKNSKVLNKI